MKIVFEKLQTSSKNVYVDFGNGTWQSYPVNEARANGINIPASCKDYSKIKIKGSAEIFPNMDVITGIKRYEKVGVNELIIPMRLVKENDAIKIMTNYGYPALNSNDFKVNAGVEIGTNIYSLREIESSLFTADGEYIKVADDRLLKNPHSMDFFVLKNLDNQLTFDGNHIISDNGEDTPYSYYINENDKYVMQSSLGSDNFTAGDIYIDMDTHSIDKNSPGLQELADLGSYSIVSYDSEEDCHFYLDSYDINESLNGEEILKPVGETLNQRLYIYYGSGSYEGTNIKLKFD